MKEKETKISLLPIQIFLTVIFFVLKVTHVVDWSWLWVLAPMWTPTAFVLGLCGVIFIPTIMISGIAYFASKKKYRKSQEKTIDNDFHVKYNETNNKNYSERSKVNSIQQRVELLKREKEFLEYCKNNDLDPKVYKMSKSYQNFTKKDN